MAINPMDPHYEQILRDEIIYLHSLWHRGPPVSARAAAATTTTTTASRTWNNLQPLNTVQFKKEKKLRRKIARKNKQNSKSPSPESKGIEWPCPTPPRPPTDWGSFETPPKQNPKSISPEAQQRFLAKQAQQKALGAVTEFIRSRIVDDDGDVIDTSDEEDDLMGDDDGPVDYSFFVKLFMDDNELREYYLKNYANGEFSCLVCGAVGGKKTGKMFKNCVALVQHSITVARIKKHAHRAYSQAICKILGWDIDQLPSITSALAEKSVEVQGNATNGDNSSVVLANNVEIPPEGGPIAHEVPLVDRQQNMQGNFSNGDNSSIVLPNNVEIVPEGESIAHEPSPEDCQQNMNSLTSSQANENVEDISKVVADNMVKPVEDLAKVVADNVDVPTKEGSTNELLKDNNAVENKLQDSDKDGDVLDGLYSRVLDGVKEDNSPKDNNAVENELQDSHKDSDVLDSLDSRVLDGLKEDNIPS